MPPLPASPNSWPLKKILLGALLVAVVVLTFLLANIRSSIVRLPSWVPFQQAVIFEQGEFSTTTMRTSYGEPVILKGDAAKKYLESDDETAKIIKSILASSSPTKP